ncbi:hypothetical protein QJS04_geneDACA000771 [Acorus gramineus]|uniref:Uncharacterized protein n=1 Tax=Acorus gramineus TaxID=55184 RepID=A0AAV9BD65_ACOGR|nr:hypothetical protein QJS04_geneDACA000771 [Acorus gramineus]
MGRVGEWIRSMGRVGKQIQSMGQAQASDSTYESSAFARGSTTKIHGIVLVQYQQIEKGRLLITEELGMNLEKVELDMFSTCKKVTISKDDSVILDGAGDKKSIEERHEQLRSAIELSTSDYDE